jgi:Flp pilus assembly protein TadG
MSLIRRVFGRQRRQRSGGQGLTEFALIVPLFFAMTIVAINIGRVIWSMDVVATSAREAARWAIVHGGAPATTCPVGPAAGDATIPNPSASCPYPAPSTRMVKDLAAARAATSGGTITVSVCYYDPTTTTSCTGDTNGPGATDARGMAVTVRVSTSLSLFTSGLFQKVGYMFGNKGIPSTYSVSGSSTMLINN